MKEIMRKIIFIFTFLWLLTLMTMSFYLGDVICAISSLLLSCFYLCSLVIRHKFLMGDGNVAGERFKIINGIAEEIIEEKELNNC